MPVSQPDGVPFSFFTSLIREIAKDVSKKSSQSHPALATFDRWLKQLKLKHSLLPSGSAAIILRLLFPHEDARRKYDMQEYLLSRELAKCLGVCEERINEKCIVDETVCFGEQLQRVLALSSSDPEGYISSLSISTVDSLLDELASKSRFSDSSVRKRISASKRRRREDVLKDLFRPLCPFDAACLAQIILKDLRPLMYPLSEKQMHYTAALKVKSNSVEELTIFDAMKMWDPTLSMLKMHRVCSSLSDAADSFERGQCTFKPSFGVQIAVPKSQKGRSIKNVLSHFEGSEVVWAETKYDGERAQIHVQITNGVPRVKIFSKSKRDSTLDRIAVHPIILECLSLDRHIGSSKVRRDVILDAEMVPFSGNKIEEFWRIRNLIEETAVGARARRNPVPESRVETQETQETDHSQQSGSINNGLQLGLVFFDVMYLNGESFLTTPYKKRHVMLESLIREIPGKAVLAQRWPIYMMGTQRHATGLASWKLPPQKRPNEDHESSVRGHARSPEQGLAMIFARRLASYEEGLVLKAAESAYNDWKLPWVKLKADYIPGLGDGLDLVVLGACWHRDRAMELRVPRGVLTTFHIGALMNQAEVETDPENTRPKYLIYFTVSYGLSREELEEKNCRFKCSDTIPLAATERYHELDYDFELRTDIPAPEMLLVKPWLAEIFGDRFTKTNCYPYYEIRWPRISKFHDPYERSWKAGKSLNEIEAIGASAMGVDEDLRRSSAHMWGKETSKTVGGLWGYRVQFWEAKLGVKQRESNQKKSSAIAESLLSQKRQRLIHVDENGSRYDSSDDGSQSLQSKSLESQSQRSITAKLSQPLRDTALNVPGAQTKGTFPRISTPDTVESQENDLDTVSPDVKTKYPSPPISPVKPALSKEGDGTYSISGKQFTTRRGISHEEGEPMSVQLNHSYTTIADFFRDAVVWYEDADTLAITDQGCLAVIQKHLEDNRVHGTGAVLTGCGWHPTFRGSSWVKQGVIFLDARSLEDFKRLLADRERRSPVGLRKPIWIFDRDRFEWVADMESLKAQALGIISS
ncbi:atp dependent dna ligase domain protein [Moniliophthora roreri MCA 2997]|uniref:Atp dependent dna ligase domain protein n=2 Tax=Moniliophthora roreri TaxID=221103 RepID=V2XU97_MONRO|nr:atp dependent dna ligase domain protein [Moniliophthora roreri MCA 2997]KAI3619723.1 atp dependent dna ligase domain protein [Moniliophthora roreri]